PERNALGSGQKTVRLPKIASPATESEIIFNTGLSSAVEIAMPAAPTKSGKAVWKTRSRLRSERCDHSTMLKSPTRYGSADTRPVCAFDSPKALTICGRKKLDP